MINRQKQHTGKSHSIDSAATEIATHVNWCYPVKSRCLIADLRVAGANTIKGVPFATYKNVSVGVHIECAIHRPVGNANRALPGCPAVGGTLELHSAAATVNTIVRLVLESVARAVGLVDG